MAIAKTHPGFGGASPIQGRSSWALRMEAKAWRIVRWRGIAVEIGRGHDRGVLERRFLIADCVKCRVSDGKGSLRSGWSDAGQSMGRRGGESHSPHGESVPPVGARRKRSAYAVLVPQDLALVAIRGEGETRNPLTEEANRSSGRPARRSSRRRSKRWRTARRMRHIGPWKTSSASMRPRSAMASMRAGCLLLDEHFRDSPDGFFVALPSRDRLLFLPVTETLPAASGLRPLAEETFRSAVHPISNRLLFGQRIMGRVRRASRTRRVEVVPPPEFVEVLQRLLPEASAQPPALPSPPPAGPAEGDMPN